MKTDGRSLGHKTLTELRKRAVASVQAGEMPFLDRVQARCCGGGGGLSASSSEMSVGIAAERVRDALAVGAEIIVSGCAACKDNLRKGVKALPKDEGGKLKVMDITEMVASSME